MNNLKHLKYKSLSLSYLVKGNGPTGIICFHGFGRSAEDFINLNLTSQVKIISINLPFHGESKFANSDLTKTLWKKDLIQCIEFLIEKENIANLILAGYSLGGKAVLCLLESNSFNIKSVALFAPDGFKSNPWYWFASQTVLGEFLNRLSVNNPWVFKSFLNLSKTFGFATKRQLQFAQMQMNSASKRQQVYDIWRAHRKLNANLTTVKLRIERDNIRLRIILGKYDKIIPSSAIINWSNSSSTSTLIEEKCGHEIPIEILNKHISALI